MKTFLIGSKPFSLSWKPVLNNLQKNNQHIIIVSYRDDVALQNALDNNNIDYLLPLSRKDYNEIKKKTHINVKILHPTDELYDLLDNKVCFLNFMLKHFKNHIPDVFILNNVKIKEPQFPVISKPAYSVLGANMKIFLNKNEFSKCIDREIVQEFITDEYEYATFMLCIDGEIITSKIIKYKFPKFYIKIHIFPPDYENVTDLNMEVFKDIMKKLNYNGGACINFKMNPDIKIFEINPRFGGSAFSNNFIGDLLHMN